MVKSGAEFFSIIHLFFLNIGRWWGLILYVRFKWNRTVKLNDAFDWRIPFDCFHLLLIFAFSNMWHMPPQTYKLIVGSENGSFVCHSRRQKCAMLFKLINNSKKLWIFIADRHNSLIVRITDFSEVRNCSAYNIATLHWFQVSLHKHQTLLCS